MPKPTFFIIINTLFVIFIYKYYFIYFNLLFYASFNFRNFKLVLKHFLARSVIDQENNLRGTYLSLVHENVEHLRTYH